VNDSDVNWYVEWQKFDIFVLANQRKIIFTVKKSPA